MFDFILIIVIVLQMIFIKKCRDDLDVLQHKVSILEMRDKTYESAIRNIHNTIDEILKILEQTVDYLGMKQR